MGEFSVIGVAYLVTGFLILAFIYKPFTRRDTPGSTAFAVTVLGCALWPLSLGVGILVGNDSITTLTWSGRLVAPTVLSVGWFLLALRIANGRPPRRWLAGALAGYVAVELLVLATNPIHHVAFDPAVVAGSETLTPDWTRWFWVQAAVNYALMATATALLAVESIRSVGLRRRQSALLSAAVIPTAVANVATLSGFVSATTDLTPAGFVVSAGIMTVALYRAEFLDVVPIARQTALEELPHGVVTLDTDGHVVDYNAIARQYFPGEAGVGATARAFFTGVPDETVRALETGTVGHLQFTVQTGNGERHLDCTSSTVERHGEATGYVVVVRDVTERIRREQQLLEQNETLSEFANIVSHDIQGPLMELRSSATTAVRTGDTTHVEQVLDAADRMDQLVDGLLDLAQTGRRIDDPKAVSLETVARRAWHSVWTTGASLTVDVDCTIEADPDRLQQLLENCVRNSVEHGSTCSQPRADDSVERGSTVGMSWSGQNSDGDRSATATTRLEQFPTDRTEVSVTIRSIPGGFAVDDDGPGVAPDQRDRVFDRGYTSSDDGTGLGLPIVRQIATAHGWSVRIEESPCGGARVAVTGVTFCEVQADSTEASR
ncbi:hypothetical protein D8Y22_14665 [Salinadaptatus halalkaliphilus]|uniref:histidine kinase n=1 Tax=Salinadaptatus halalkaliphilus TaxID=2419781 RepID=A0A4S3TKR0_9EURY|nr:histidine kinase N-terminal 7TM domain-containing protein [Salinadaptatus halalkaliphilus]THE64150.1 hypothetical protein D8Y22_14665 [Salinadaptatus halalkaliphilus]